MTISELIIKELKLKPFQVENTLKLLSEGNTIPFISRYRKELTGNLDEENIRRIDELNNYYTNLFSYKETVIKSIEEQGKMTEELQEKIKSCFKLSELEDIYLPYKKRKKTKADIAIEAGLDKPADLILNKKIDDINFLDEFICENFNSRDLVLEGIGNIIGQKFSHDSEIRNMLRNFYEKYGFISSSKKKDFKEEKTKYDMYDDFNQKISSIQDYRTLALNRGEKENVLNVSCKIDDKYIDELYKKYYTKWDMNNEIIKKGLDYGFKNMLNPSIEREVRQSITEKAEENSISLFSTNLRQLLLTPPLKMKRVLAIDPGYRTGCKVVALDETGKFLQYETIFPVPPKNDFEGAKKTVLQMIKDNKLNLIVIGNGTASRETQAFIVDLIKNNKLDIKYIFANEAGASVYSASKLAKKEFPDFDVTVRGAISIGRRVQDPLAELVKIDPKSIGVGQYQHDVNQKNLKEKLDSTIDSVVNLVGVNINSASASLLEHISGITSKIAENIVNYRDENGSFKQRKEILKVKGLGPKSFEQCAGFIRIPNGNNPLEKTSIHPESYDTAIKLMEKIDFTPNLLNEPDSLQQLDEKLNKINLREISEELEVGLYTLEDIIKELKKPGRDPRDSMPQPIVLDDILTFNDLGTGMILEGKITNLTDFGAFVDIGIKESGLIHRSNLSEKFIKHPSEVVSINQIVEVEILNIDKDLKRINLKLIKIKK